ncbi:hypothetical protein NBRC116583_25000 [Arenicella sp. 4NH20-0111]|uniref:heparinase II/III domain-containing protein n=1 Tax=Arenicella sp. 4NH20-0111 TaxID=3127648 RepID=UPI00310AE543
MNITRLAITLFLLSFFSLTCFAKNEENPRLILTIDDAAIIRSGLNESPTFMASFSHLKRKVDATMAAPIDVPIPLHAGGGYTHEQHKRNNNTIYEAGLLYQLTSDRKYFDHARALLLAYADLYPTLGEHPNKKEQSPGRLFWQSLNEAVWLVYSIQGYDAILSSLSDQDRERIEEGLLRPMTNFLSKESPQTFNKIHNHGTWAVAAVGMTGYVLNDLEMVEQSLMGLDKSGDFGFLKQIDKLFSPDGYYTEGPYYQRYALMPFVLFARAIENNEPERKIFEHRNGLLLKAIYATVQLSYNKLFFPINDAIKDKSIETTELVNGISIAYGLTNDPALLDIATLQGRVSISGDGYRLAKGIDDGLIQPFPYRSMHFKDGENGDQGALTIFRSGLEHDHQALVLKNTSQGLGHGHFDRLNWLYFDNGEEIVSDYGAARFLNIESKYGGHYLPENNLYAKQTIAHNTLVVDQQSQYLGKWRLGQKYAPEIVFVEQKASHEATSAIVDSAYDGVVMQRTMALVSHPSLSKSLVLDLLKVSSDSDHQYDLPIHFQGHITNVVADLEASVESRSPLGKANGYQFLWKEAKATPNKKLPQVTWINSGRFYTASFAHSNFSSSENGEMLFTRIGANDPDFNLRSEQAVIQRVSARDHTFLSILETHGEYNPILEYTNESASNVASLVLIEKRSADVVLVELKNGKNIAIAIGKSGAGNHKITVANQSFSWSGWVGVFDY